MWVFFWLIFGPLCVFCLFWFHLASIWFLFLASIRVLFFGVSDLGFIWVSFVLYLVPISVPCLCSRFYVGFYSASIWLLCVFDSGFILGSMCVLFGFYLFF